MRTIEDHKVNPATTNESSGLASQPLLSRKELAQYLGMSARATHALTSAPWFPNPVELSPRILKWRRVEVDEALANAPRRAAGGEPAQLQQARAKRQG